VFWREAVDSVERLAGLHVQFTVRSSCHPDAAKFTMVVGAGLHVKFAVRTSCHPDVGGISRFVAGLFERQRGTLLH
jgi:hypothetical protein